MLTRGMRPRVGHIRRFRSQYVLAVPIVSLIAMVGTYLLFYSFAATMSTSVEPESGSRSGGVAIVSNAQASGGSAIKFAATKEVSDLASPVKKEIAMQLVSSAENSSLNWKAQYAYIEWNVEGVASENRGYTAGIIGFCSGCGDMTELLRYYQSISDGNILEKYIPAIQIQEDLGMGHVTQAGLGQAFINDWKAAAATAAFQRAQNDERDRVYFNPAVNQAKADGLRALGQFVYYDAMVMHGPGSDSLSFGGIRMAALRNATPPSQGGNEATFIEAFLQARVAAMQAEAAHSDTSRVDDAQRKFLQAGNLDLNPPLNWSVYGDQYSIATNPTP